MSEPTCETCRFWADEDTEHSGLGDCHRYPPRMAVEVRAGRPETVRPQDGGWPLTFPDDWCGEHKPRPLAASVVDQALFAEPVTALGLSPRVLTCLRHERIESVGQLVSLTVDDVNCFRNFGPVRLAELTTKLEQRGLRLRLMRSNGEPSP